jgi:MFS superfamily sulfate permease-like transporter
MSRNGLSRFPIPILEWVQDYPTAWLRPDVIAGLTAAAVVIPKAMAYTTVAGLPIQIGLYPAIVPMIVYAVLGTSRPLSVSTTTTIAILTAAALGPLAESRDTALLFSALATLTLLVGAFLIFAGLVRFGFVASFISEPVLIGFKAGIGLVIVLDQVPKLLGIHIHKGSFVQNVLAILNELPHATPPTVAVAAATFVLLILLERYVPRVPAPLVAGGIAAMNLFGLAAIGVEATGQVPTGLPSFTLPGLALVEQLWVPALGIALMSFTETMATGRAFARADEPVLRPNRELLATGLSNVAGAFWGAMPAGGGTSQTAINRRAGASSQLAALMTAAVALLTLLFLAPLISMMPQATLVAIVIVYSVGLIKPAEFWAVLQVRRTEFIWALASLVGVVMLGTLQGIVVAISCRS